MTFWLFLLFLAHSWVRKFLDVVIWWKQYSSELTEHFCCRLKVGYSFCRYTSQWCADPSCEQWLGCFSQAFENPSAQVTIFCFLYCFLSLILNDWKLKPLFMLWCGLNTTKFPKRFLRPNNSLWHPWLSTEYYEYMLPFLIFKDAYAFSFIGG